MHNKIIVSSYRAYSSREQARFIRKEANLLIEKANEFSTTSRRVNRRSAYKVLARSLEKTRGLPFSIRKHQAITELSNYISLAKYNKIIGLEAFNTDLLPTSHPRSTRMNSMTASALAEAQMRWVLDDPRIKDETVKGLLASAMFSPIDSPEHKYSMVRLENMPQGQVPVEVLLAAANPFAGKNSAAARRAREAVQLSDRFERWINMGRSLAKRATDGFRVYVSRNDGSTKSLSGELLNQHLKDPQLVDIEIGKGKVAVVPTKLGEGLEAFIKSKDSEDGYSPVEAQLPNGAQAIPESSIPILDAPSIYRKDDGSRWKNSTKYTDDKYDVIKFDNPKAAQEAISDGQKRADEIDKAQPKLLKKGEIDADSGKQVWDIDEPVFGVYRRGKGTPLAFTQSWKDVNNEILLDEPLLDEDEGRSYTRPEPQTADDNVPLLDQADDIFKPTKKKDDKKKKKEVSSFPYEVPDRAYELNPNEEYTPEFEFDDPVTIANDQVAEELEDALLTAVEPVSDTEKATGYAPISFTDGRERDVSAEAIAAAIREQGGDAEMALAQAYDKIAGNNNNQEALEKSRGAKDEKELEEETKKADKILKDAEKEAKKIKKPTSDEIIEEEVQKPDTEEPKTKKPISEEEPVADIVDEGGDRFVPSLLKGLSEEELAGYKKDGDYRSYLPKNADIDTPEGLYKLDPNPVDPAENLIPKELESEYPFYNPADLAKDNSTKTLTSKLEDAIKGTGPQGPGFGELDISDPNLESAGAPVSAEALRDALQLQGKDTDAIIDKINKKAEKAKAKLKPKDPVEETPVVKEQTPAKPSIEGKDPLKLDDPFKPEDWIEADGPFADLLNSNENFTRLEGLGDLIDIDSPLSRKYKTNKYDLNETTGGEYGDELEAIDDIDFETGPAGKVQYGLKILNEADWSSRRNHEKLATTKGKIAALNDSKNILEDALNDLKTDKKETAAVNSVLKSIDKEIKKLEKEKTKADKEEEEKNRKKVVEYKRAGTRTLLRGRSGAPFKDKEIADFLDENGFEWTPTYETAQGEVRNVNAETKLQSDEEFRAFAKELRDRFDIDLQPRAETPTSPAQEPIDFDAPTPTPTPTPVEEPAATPEVVEPNIEDDPRYKEIVEEISMLDRLMEKEDLEPDVRQLMVRRKEKLNEELESLKEGKPADPSAEVPPTPPTPPVTPPSGEGEDDGEDKDSRMKEGLTYGFLKSLLNKYLTAFFPAIGRNRWMYTDEENAFIDSLDGMSSTDALRKVYEKIKSLNWDEVFEDLGVSEDAIKALIANKTKAEEDEVEDDISGERYKKDEVVNSEDVINEAIVESVKDEKAYDLNGLIRKLEKKRAKEDGALDNPYDLNRKGMISRIMWFKWGNGFAKNESPYIRNAMKKFEKGLEKLSNAELVQILDLYYDEIDLRIAEENAAQERAQKLREIRARKRREREDKLIQEDEEGEAEPTSEESPDGRKRLKVEERPTAPGKPGEISPEGDWVYFPGQIGGNPGFWMESPQLMEKYKKYGFDVSKWPEFEEEEPKPEEPAAEETAEEEKPDFDGPWLFDPSRDKYFSPNADWVFVEDGKGGGKWVLTTTGKKKGAEDREKIPTGNPFAKPEGESAEETGAETPTPTTPAPTSKAKLVKGVTTDQLKPGDVLVDGHFTITKIEREGTKKVNVGGVTQDIPAYRVTGYYPNSVEQSSKLWSENYSTDLYRGATPPAKGDLPELNQPKADDYGPEYVWPNVNKVKFKDRTLYAPKNAELEKKFLEDYAKYDAERLRREAMWEAPQTSPEAPSNPIYFDNVPASEIKVGDIAFRKNKFGAREFFTVTKVVSVTDENTVIEGHYVGHQTQTKEWRSRTPIDVIRGETNLPQAGDKEPLDRPDKALPNYGQLEKDRQAKIAEADKGYTFNAEPPTPKVSKPKVPPFYGDAETLLDGNADGASIQKALDKKGFVVFDFETLGNDVQNVLNPDAPIQAAAVKYVNGEKVDELNIFINPGKPLGTYYYTQADNKTPYLDANGNNVMNPEKIIKNGDIDVTDEWLATQPDLKEQLQKLVDFFGENPTLVGQNVDFDINVLQRWAEKLGIDFKLTSSIDTAGIARALQKIEASTVTFPKNPKEGDKAFSALGNAWTWKNGRWSAPSNSLKPLAERLGIDVGADGFHNALFDVEMTEKVLRKLLENVKAGDLPTGGTAPYEAAFKKWLESLANEKEAKAKREADKIASAVIEGKNESTDIDSVIKDIESVEEETVTIVNGDESSDEPKAYVSPLYKDRLTSDWIRDPENTDFIPNARVKDLKIGDFIFGSNGKDLLEVISFENDEKQPENAVRVIRADIETGQVLSDRKSPRDDGGTGWFFAGPVEGGIYRRKDNADKTNAQIETETIEAIEDVDPVIIPEEKPVKGEEVTPEQAETVVNDAIDTITTSKPDASIEEAVKGLNVDETIKDQVLTPPDAASGGSPLHISADKVTGLKQNDKVMHANTKRIGIVSVLLEKYGKKGYTNYVKVRYEDSGEREPVASKNLTIIYSAPEAGSVRKPNRDETSVTEITAKIKDIRTDATVESELTPEELAQNWKDAETARDAKVSEVNFVKTSSDVVGKIKENLPARGVTSSSLPSLKTGKPFDVNFVFDKPNAKELEKLAIDLNLDSEEDLIVFRAGKEGFLRNQPIATIKPDGSIVWQKENDKRSFSLELEKVLQDFDNPLSNFSPMIVVHDPEDTEGTDAENYGNGTLLGETESSFDYDNISKFPPTKEQRSIVDAIMRGKDVVVQALAGTGKTSTLVLAAKRILAERPDSKLLYIVFNKETAEEAQGRMPENVDSRTMDNIVYSMVSKSYKDRNKLSELFKIGERSLIDYMDNITLFEYYKYEQVKVMIRGTETNLGMQDLVPEIREAVNRFAISGDEVLSEKHFAKKTPFFDSVPPILVDYAKRMWDDVSTEEGWDPTSTKLSRIDYSHMLKAWALTNPQFADGLNSGATSNGSFKNRKNDMFFFDEAQDMNPVIVKLLADQENIQKVYVGDSNQAIYAFRGAVDELNNVKDAVELYLTQTFRFGAKLAAVGNRFLSTLKSKKKIVGKPGEDDGVVFEKEMEDPDVIIARTNGGVLDSVFDLLAKGKNPGLNLETYYKALSYARSAQWLMAANKGTPPYKKPKIHEDLAGFQNWNEVLKAVQDGKSVGGAMYMVRLLRDRRMSIKDVVDKLNSITPIRGTGFRDDVYVPVGKEAIKDGITGTFGEGRINSGHKGKLNYTIKDGVLELPNSKSYLDFLVKNPEWITKKGVNKEGKEIEYKVATVKFTKDQEDDILTLINDISRWVQNYAPRIPIDTEVITAHKSKGKEWNRVKLHDDFKQPEVNDEGELELPDDEERRISYVAVTRAKKAIDIGDSLKWVFDVTTEDDEKPELTDVEKLMGMTVTADPEPVTPEEIGNQVIKDRKITDQKTLEVAEKLVELIKKGVVPWRQGWSGGKLFNPKTKHAFQGSNVLTLWGAMAENDWSDPRFLNIKQVNALGGRVIKGSKGTTILKPNGNFKDVKQPDGTTKKEGYVWFSAESYFNVAQVTGIDFPPLVKKDPVPILEIETQILESYKDHPEIINRFQSGAFYRPSEDKIYLPLREQFDSSIDFIETLFHELGHSTGHPSRLGKDGKRKDLLDNYGDHRASRGEEELIADITVALIAAEFGVEIDWGNTASYVDGWLKPLQDDPGMIIVAARQAQQAVNWMLGIKPGDENNTPATSFPGLQDYKDGGSGGLVGSRSTVGFVSTDALKDMAGNVAGNEEAIESYRKSLREGKGFAIRDFNGKPFNDPIMVIYDDETGMAFVGEGNHRLQAAIAENIPFVPVRVVRGKASEMVEDAEKGKFPKQIKNGKEPKFVETTGSTSGQPVSEGYVPPEMHPSYVFDKEFISDVLPDFVTQSDPLAPPVAGEGVGSEGQTGEEIAGQTSGTPEATPEPNVGEQGQTGEEIAAKVPKNKDTSMEPTKITIGDEEYDLWDDITYDRTSEEGAKNEDLNKAHGVLASKILKGQDLITDRNEIGRYIADILKKNGFGNKLFYLARPTIADQMLDRMLGPDSKDGVEAAVGLAKSGEFADGDPLKNVEFPLVLVRKRGISKVGLLHEIAHLMEAGWRSNAGGGHNNSWHQTFLTLLRQEGFQTEADLLSSSIGELKGDTGVINP